MDIYRETIRRELARRHLIPFTQFTFPNFEVARHHHVVASVLEDVANGKRSRVILMAPPRHTKSELASRRFPAWYLGRFPRSQIIAATYNSEFAGDFGQEVRDIVGSDEYHALFNTQLRQDAKAKQKFKTSKGGIYISAGIGTAITGRGADVFLIDDPFKDHEEADSQSRRELVWNWFSSVAYTRLMPNGRIVLIMTRWHEDDLAGRLIENMKKVPGADQYEIIELQAWDENRSKKPFMIVECEFPDDWDDPAENLKLLDTENYRIKKQSARLVHLDDGALWPEWYGGERLKQIKANILPRHWQALYQQKPRPEDGAYFKRKNLRWYVTRDQLAANLGPDNKLLADLPTNYGILPGFDDLQLYGTSDYATKEGEGDWTVHCVWGVDQWHNIYLIAMWREQMTSIHWCEAAVSLMKSYRPLAWFEEKGQIIGSVGPFLTRMMDERRVYTHRVQYVSRRDKSERARSIQGRTEMGKVYLPYGQPWADTVVDELLSFPTGKHDDIVDNFSLIGRALDKLIPGLEQDHEAERAEHEKRRLAAEGKMGVTLEDLYGEHKRSVERARREAAAKILRS